MRVFNQLPVLGIIFGLLLMGGCSGGGDAPPTTPLDEASRLVVAKAEFQRLQCECDVQAGTYASVASCKADKFKLEPDADAQCLRDIFAANPLDVPTIACELSTLEGLSSCIAAASCNEEASQACLAGLEGRQDVCPKGPATSGDTFGIDLANGVSFPFPGGLSLNMPMAEIYFDDNNFYPSTPVTKLPTFTNDDDDLLNDDVDSLSGGKLTDAAGTIEYNVDIIDFTVAIDPIETYKYNYTATGTLTNTTGSDALGLNGVPLFISVKHDINAVPDSTSEESVIRRAQWSVMADYSIGIPFVPGSIMASAPTRLLAKDSFLDASIDSCQNLPGDQLAVVYGESLDANYDELCRCAPDDATRSQCLLSREGLSPRVDCLDQLVDLNPLAAEVTECIVEELDFETDAMTGMVCCANPGDSDCLSSSGTFTAAQTFSRCATSAVTRDTANAIFFCMGPPPPPPVPTVDFSSDPARCDNTKMLASGVPGDFMVVTASRQLDGSGIPYPRHYIILDLVQLSDLATFDAAQPLLTALYGIDAGSPTEVKDQCDQPNIVSIALDGDGTPPDFGSVNARISDVQNGLAGLPAAIALGKMQAEAYVKELYKASVCPAFTNMTDFVKIKVPGPGSIYTSAIATAIAKKAILSAVGC